MRGDRQARAGGGAPKGNKNALKHGARSAETLALKREIQALSLYAAFQGAIATMVGIGASLSGLATGEVVDRLRYSAAFLTLGAVALAAVTVFATAMPETADTTAERIARAIG